MFAIYSLVRVIIYIDGSQEEQYLIHNLFTNANDARKKIEKDYKNKR